MPPNRPRSGQLLEGLWLRFAAGYVAKYSGTKAPSKRTVSGWLAADSHALARWTNDGAHQAGHPQWRIPLRRVPGLCHVLLAAQDDINELMFARVQEIQESEEMSDVPVLMHWLMPIIAELAERPVVDALERQVLKAFNRAAAATPGAGRVPVPLPDDVELEAAMQSWLSQAVDEYLQELQVESEGRDAGESSALSERAKQATAVLRKRKAAVKHTPPTSQEMTHMVNQVRRAIRPASKG